MVDACYQINATHSAKYVCTETSFSNIMYSNINCESDGEIIFNLEEGCIGNTYTEIISCRAAESDDTAVFISIQMAVIFGIFTSVILLI